MRRISKGIKAQSTLEYALLISVVIAALIGMQVYMKRGMIGKLRESTDSVGQQFDPDANTGGFTLAWKSEDGGVTSNEKRDGLDATYTPAAIHAEDEDTVMKPTTTTINQTIFTNTTDHVSWGGESLR